MVGHSKWAVIVLVVALVAGCSGSVETPTAVTSAPTAVPSTVAPPSATTAPQTETPAPQAEQVSFTSEDGVKLAGRFYPADGGTAVIFTHMGLTDQSSWQDFAAQVANQGIPALTFDFRCYGVSECAGSNLMLHLKDMNAAIDFLRGRGYQSMICVGASLGSNVCAAIALREELAGMVLIAGQKPTRMAGKSFPESLVDPEMPKLYIVTEQDRFEPVRADIREMYDQSPEPKQLKVFPGTAHGTELFDTQYADEFRQVLLDFIIDAASKEGAMILPTSTPVPTLQPLVEQADLKNNQGPVYSHVWSPDGSLLAAAGYAQVNLWEVKTRQHTILQGHSSYVWGVAWAPDGKTLASASQDGTVRLWDMAAYTQTATLETGWAFCVDWSPDGSRLVVGTNSGELQVWDPATPEQLSSWASPSSSPIISVGWSPDGKVIASGEWSGEIYLWEVESGQIRRSLSGYTSKRSDTNGLAWSPDGRTLATAHQDGAIRLWDIQSGEMIRLIEAHTGWARGVAWSPDGSLLASSGQDRRAVIWDAGSGQWLAEVVHNNLPVWSVAWSPDGEQFSSGSGAYEEQRSGVTIVWLVQR